MEISTSNRTRQLEVYWKMATTQLITAQWECGEGRGLMGEKTRPQSKKRRETGRETLLLTLQDLFCQTSRKTRGEHLRMNCCSQGGDL